MVKRTILLILFTLGLLFAQPQLVEPGKACIRIDKGMDISAFKPHLAALGVIQIQPRFQTTKDKGGLLKDIYELSFDPKISPYSLVNALSKHPGIVYAEPIFIDEVLESPDDFYYAQSLNFASMQAEAAWDIHKCENGTQPTIIGIVDTGVAWKHPDLAQNIWQNLGEDANSNGYTMYHNGSTWIMDTGDLNSIDDDGNGKIDDLIGWNLILTAAGGENNDPNDPGSHGTRVAGLAGARTNNGIGVASLSWNPILMPISCAYLGDTTHIYRGYDGIIYAAENGAHVINCSWGGTGHSQANKEAIDYASSLGTLIVAAAGNDDNSIPFYPAAYPKVLATASLNNDGVKWSGSNYGAYLDLGTPNQSAYSTAPPSSYLIYTGATSFASPIASALAALIKSQNPGMSREELAYQMKASCDNIDAQNPSLQYLLGQGKINAYRALSEPNASISEALKLELFSIEPPNDSNANLAIEPGESFSLNLKLRNYTEFSALASFTLSTNDPDLQIVNSTHQVTIPQDEFFSLADAFEVLVSEGASSHYASFTLTASSLLPIHSSAAFTFNILIQNGGILVWEAKAGARNQSGTFFKNQFIAQGRQVVYGNSFPASFKSFEAVFLSFGANDKSVQTLNEPWMYEAIRDYLLEGGKLYVEGADAIGFDLEYYLDAHTVLWPLLGIATGEDGATNPINLLSTALPFSDLSFTATTQSDLRYIDLFTPHPLWGDIAFTEEGYGTVGIAGAGEYGQKTVVFSYALAELTDGAEPNTRAKLLHDILIWFMDSPLVELQSLLPILQLSWQSIPLARAYRIYHSDQPLGDWDVLIDNHPGTSLEINPLEQRKFYRVQAIP
ncbi:MAG: S8 family serine peptidase [Candidatus Cloacimonadaceae bacterium]|jgi:subtilisin family serine protease|nr:S8 family serine peptidase [Candidatus Cloacimonadaceae bacterium]